MQRNGDVDPVMVLGPRELAADMIATFRSLDEKAQAGHWNEHARRYAVHRAAEVRAWEMHKAHGGYESAKGRQFAQAATEIAEYFHDVPWKDERSSQHVPLLGIPQ